MKRINQIGIVTLLLLTSCEYLTRDVQPKLSKDPYSIQRFSEPTSFPYKADPDREAFIRQRYTAVQNGMTGDEVLSLFGQPDEVRALRFVGGPTNGWAWYYFVNKHYERAPDDYDNYVEVFFSKEGIVDKVIVRLDAPPRPTPLPSGIQHVLAVAPRLAKLELIRDPELEAEIAKIAEEARGKVGVAAVLLKTGDAALLNSGDQFPMQSVYKLPIAMAVMEQVRLGKLDLDQKVAVSKDDFVRKGMRSPLRDENPNGGEFAIRELLRLALVESDGTASDVLMRVAGGASEIQNYLTQIGITDMKVVNTEKEIGRDWETQYQNWTTPVAAAELIRSLWEGNCDEMDEKCQELLLILHDFMAESIPGPRRLKGLLPKGLIAHKTGTSGTQNGITAATNDIGLVHVQNDKQLAIAVFVSDSPADEKTREAVIAKIAKAVWDKWNKN